ncbi:MAG: hypothetical protein VW891_15385 [Novosphingobium sp.]
MVDETGKQWTNQKAWAEMVTTLFYPAVDTEAFRRVDSGTYNRVWRCVKTSSLFDNPTLWPPQLRHIVGNIVVRISKRPYSDNRDDCTEGLNAYARYTNDDRHICTPADSFREIALTLRAAMLGIGPTVHAIARWPKSMVRQGASGYLHTMILQHAGCNLSSRFSARSLDSEITPVLRAVAGLVERVAEAGLLNFDLKPSNICVADDGAVRLVDFDSAFVLDLHEELKVHEEPLSSRAIDWALRANDRFVDEMRTPQGAEPRFFIMMLLLAVHVRMYSTENVCAVFVRLFHARLMDLWLRMIRNRTVFGVCESICSAQMMQSRKEGGFNANKLNAIPNAVDRVRRMIEMIAYEYALRDSGLPEAPSKKRLRDENGRESRGSDGSGGSGSDAGGGDGLRGDPPPATKPPNAAKRWRTQGGRDQWTACAPTLGIVPRLLRFSLYFHGVPRDLPREMSESLR